MNRLQQPKHSSALPRAFTEQGAAVLSSDLNRVFEAIKQIFETETNSRKKTGFTVKERQAGYGKRVKKKLMANTHYISEREIQNR